MSLSRLLSRLTATLEAADHTFLLTTVPRETTSDALLAELYPVRRQIEMAFKPLKSLVHLDERRARSPELARVDLLAKLIVAVLVDLVARQTGAPCSWCVPCLETRSAAGAGPEPSWTPS